MREPEPEDPRSAFDHSFKSYIQSDDNFVSGLRSRGRPSANNNWSFLKVDFNGYKCEGMFIVGDSRSHEGLEYLMGPKTFNWILKRFHPNILLNKTLMIPYTAEKFAELKEAYHEVM